MKPKVYVFDFLKAALKEFVARCNRAQKGFLLPDVCPKTEVSWAAGRQTRAEFVHRFSRDGEYSTVGIFNYIELPPVGPSVVCQEYVDATKGTAALHQLDALRIPSRITCQRLIKDALGNINPREIWTTVLDSVLNQ